MFMITSNKRLLRSARNDKLDKNAIFVIARSISDEAISDKNNTTG